MHMMVSAGRLDYLSPPIVHRTGPGILRPASTGRPVRRSAMRVALWDVYRSESEGCHSAKGPARVDDLAAFIVRTSPARAGPLTEDKSKRHYPTDWLCEADRYSAYRRTNSARAALTCGERAFCAGLNFESACFHFPFAMKSVLLFRGELFGFGIHMGARAIDIPTAFVRG